MIKKSCMITILLTGLVYGSAWSETADTLQDALGEAFSAYGAREYTKAFNRFIPLADSGNVSAQFMLGMMRKESRVLADDIEAVEWFRKAAEQNDVAAQFELGHMYRDGRGVPQNDAEALKWYRKAAEGGLYIAQRLLGNAYEKGHLTARDDIEAYRWYSLAAARTSEKKARARMQSLRKKMPRWQIDEAQRRADETWKRLPDSLSLGRR